MKNKIVEKQDRLTEIRKQILELNALRLENGGIIPKKEWQTLISTLRDFEDLLSTGQPVRTSEDKAKSEAESKARFFNLALDMLCIAGTDGFFKVINPAFTAILGYEADELLGKPFLDFIHPEDIESTLAEVSKLAEGQLTIDFENRYKCKDGNFKWLSWKSSPDPETGVLYAVARDITENKEAEERFRVLFERSSDPHLIFDQDGIIDCNHATVQILKCKDKKEVLFLHPGLLSPEFQPDGRRSDEKSVEMDKIALEKGFHRFDWVHKKMDGALFTVEVTLTPVQLNAKNALLVVWHDLTHRIQQEKKLNAYARELERSNKELEQFGYIVSHDLKAPLRAISTLSTFVEEDLMGKVDPETEDNLKLIRSRVGRMEQMISGILDYSKIGKSQSEKRAVNLNVTLEQTLDAIGRPDSFHFKIAKNLPTITAIPIQIQQVFQNLIGNALKYHDKSKGVIEVTYEKIPGNHLFRIKDDGPGIEPKFQKKVFEIFQKLDSRDNVEGTGIGLSIVQKIIEDLGGKIWLESKLGEGSTFCFEIPVEKNS